jgi:aldehyde dehydrogenase (NAD+)
LALYIFSENKKNIDFLVNNTRSGAVSINETVSHASFRDLPFGGTGSSGFGRYYGKYSFDTFSHERSVLWRPLLKDPNIRYPPYTPYKLSIIRKLRSYNMPAITSSSIIAGLSTALFTRKPVSRIPRSKL